MPPYCFSLQQCDNRAHSHQQSIDVPVQPELLEAAKLAIQSSVTKETILRRYNYQAHYVDCRPFRNHSLQLCGLILKEAGGTVRAKIAALKNLVTSKGHGWRGGSHLREVLSGIERAAPPSSFRPEQEPMKVDWLDLLHNKLDKSGHTALNSCIVACVDAIFYGQLRLGEVLLHTSILANYDSSKLPLVSNLTIPAKTDRSTSAKLRLPCTKTHQSRGESVVLINHNTRSNAVCAVSRHLEVNSLLQSDPLFSYRLPNNSLQVLSKKEFLKFCNRVWASASIKWIMGHSFRTGGTTHYLTKGIPPDIVKAMGRWKPDTFLKYW
ncbi:hypothetical protein F5876DRAFT_81464 [Lentinula aff. lateritia]|uniref:Uncharacterized protein n=1 Tax=Lentinula aff. lateritia TaxID=2804960 RepID=A0ACC1TM82_9AGAR|nr:hypothetical protein F5876DRAFT_81464 [Lentinula aff. lateritia]